MSKMVLNNSIEEEGEKKRDVKRGKKTVRYIFKCLWEEEVDNLMGNIFATRLPSI